MKTMLGCMVSSSSSISVKAAAHLSPLIDYADLEANLLIANDPYHGVTVQKGRLVLPDGPGLGVHAVMTFPVPSQKSEQLTKAMMRLVIGGFAVLIAVLSCTNVALTQVPAAAIGTLFSKFVSAHDPGCAVLVIKDGQPVFRQGYGLTDLRTLQKIGPETNFRLASLTKQFTAAAVMLLVHDGKLQYEDRLTDVFPDFPAYAKAITIRQLLYHTSGLVDYEDIMAKQYAGISEEKIPQIRDAGVLDLLKRQTSTIAYEKGRNEVTHRAYGHTRTSAGWSETDQSSTSATLGDGGVYTSLDDLEKWDGALAHH